MTNDGLPLFPTDALEAGDLRTLCALLDRLSAPCLLTDAAFQPEGPRILHANRAQTELCGYPLEEMVGRTPRILHGEETDLESLRRFRLELETVGYSTVDTVNYRRDGSAYEALLYGTRVASNDGQGGGLRLCIGLAVSEAPLCADRREEPGTL